MQVDLPAPFGPIRAWTVPGSIAKDTSDRAAMPPKRTVTFSTASRFGGSAVGIAGSATTTSVDRTGTATPR
jgi:hypothetical protein